MGIATHFKFEDSRRLKSPSRFPLRAKATEFPTYRVFFMNQDFVRGVNLVTLITNLWSKNGPTNRLGRRLSIVGLLQHEISFV